MKKSIIVLFGILVLLGSNSLFSQGLGSAYFQVQTYVNAAPSDYTYGYVNVMNTDVSWYNNNQQFYMSYNFDNPFAINSVGTNQFTGTINVRVDFWKIRHDGNHIHWVGYGSVYGYFNQTNPAVVNINSYQIANDN